MTFSVPYRFGSGTQLNSMLFTQIDDDFQSLRQPLSGNGSYFVATTGSDSNDGGVSTPFATIQHALGAAKRLDLGGFTLTISVADGTYAESLLLDSPFVGGTVILQGNVTTPANCIIASPGDGLLINNLSSISIQGFKITAGGSGGSALRAKGGSVINILGKMEYGTCAAVHQYSEDNSKITNPANGSYVISGGAGFCHWLCSMGGVIDAMATSITLTGTPGFSIFVYLELTGILRAISATWSGAATGTRFSGSSNSAMHLGGRVPDSVLPGNAPGSLTTGAQAI